MLEEDLRTLVRELTGGGWKYSQMEFEALRDSLGDMDTDACRRGWRKLIAGREESHKPSVRTLIVFALRERGPVARYELPVHALLRQKILSTHARVLRHKRTRDIRPCEADDFDVRIQLDTPPYPPRVLSPQEDAERWEVPTDLPEAVGARV